MTKKFKIGLVGYGTIGKVHEKVVRSQDNNFELVAISDTKQSKTPKGIRWYNNYKDLLSKERVDAISIATPPSSHYQIASDCISANKHVLVEKPPTIDSKKCRHLEKLAKKKGVTFFTAFHMRYNPAVLQAIKKLASANVEKIEITFREYVFNFHDPSRWIFNPAISGGGVLMDSGINALSVVKSVLQDNFNYRIKKVCLVKTKEMKVETEAQVEFVFGERSIGSLKMDWLYKPKDIRKLIFYTRNKKYTVNINKGSLSENGHALFKIDLRYDTMFLEYLGVYEHFQKTIQQRISFASIEELQFVESAYKKAGLNY